MLHFRFDSVWWWTVAHLDVPQSNAAHSPHATFRFLGASQCGCLLKTTTWHPEIRSLAYQSNLAKRVWMDDSRAPYTLVRPSWLQITLFHWKYGLFCRYLLCHNRFLVPGSSQRYQRITLLPSDEASLAYLPPRALDAELHNQIHLLSVPRDPYLSSNKFCDASKNWSKFRHH